MGHTYEEERRTCNWHLRHIANAELPKAHSGEHVLAIMSRISMHSSTTASWHLFPNTEYSLGSLETGHAPNLKLRSHKNALLRYLINNACLLAYCQIRNAEWQRKIIHFRYAKKKRSILSILMYSTAHGKKKILKGLEAASAHILRSRNTVTVPQHMDRKSEIQRFTANKCNNEEQEWLALWL